MTTTEAEPPECDACDTTTETERFISFQVSWGWLCRSCKNDVQAGREPGAQTRLTETDA